ncbi:CinA family protein [Zoogloea sp.]|uniref:CinA family protein n=1 Tax=Zoogloea sp. TaxID=49181 RepID=UPI0025DF1930|nr:nicotinamide-nucleotide amidohydrolase family protein [Zoogloea sp.]MCK6394852.1 nicotinamide-nucleotide amidohydrolase family protein [Zoogloea sp.]
MDTRLEALSRAVGDHLQSRGWRLATAESCTGGWVAEVVTATAGSSAWFDCGFITYSNDAKCALLGVSPMTLARHGAVSEQTTAAMVRGTLERAEADLALSISGVAGPTGGSPEKPVGTVCFGWGRAGETPGTATCHFDGDRESVRYQAVVFALEELLRRYA